MLTWPLVIAALLAGGLGGVHCVAMCGALSQWLGQAASGRVIALVPARAKPGWHGVLRLHLGRILTYAGIGAFAGATGGLGMLLRPLLPLHMILLLAGNLALMYLGLRLAGVALPWRVNGLRGLGQGMRWPQPGRFPPFLNGLAWGCLPCGLLYTVLPFALLSGSAWSGAVLLLLFGLATLPWLLLVPWLKPVLSRQRPLWRWAGALLLLCWGVLGLLQMAGVVAAPSAAWCLPG